jgi:hypothetical protein
MAARTMEEMPDGISNDQGGLSPLHLDVAGRADWRIQVIECTLNLVDHYCTLPVFAVAYASTWHKLSGTTKVKPIRRRTSLGPAALPPELGPLAAATGADAG